MQIFKQPICLLPGHLFFGSVFGWMKQNPKIQFNEIVYQGHRKYLKRVLRDKFYYKLESNPVVQIFFNACFLLVPFLQHSKFTVHPNFSLSKVRQMHIKRQNMPENDVFLKFFHFFNERNLSHFPPLHKVNKSGSLQRINSPDTGIYVIQYVR